jgi:DNA (cytosine-5)-methyltransferase 1
MKWDAPSPTITGACLTLSSGRFGHPEKNRTISVREAATLQTFPSSYKFETTALKKACQMIGNALPCEFAKAAATSCVRAISTEKA